MTTRRIPTEQESLELEKNAQLWNHHSCFGQNRKIFSGIQKTGPRALNELVYLSGDPLHLWLEESGTELVLGGAFPQHELLTRTPHRVRALLHLSDRRARHNEKRALEIPTSARSTSAVIPATCLANSLSIGVTVASVPCLSQAVFLSLLFHPILLPIRKSVGVNERLSWRNAACKAPFNRNSPAIQTIAASGSIRRGTAEEG